MCKEHQRLYCCQWVKPEKQLSSSSLNIPPGISCLIFLKWKWSNNNQAKQPHKFENGYILIIKVRLSILSTIWLIRDITRSIGHDWMRSQRLAEGTLRNKTDTTIYNTVCRSLYMMFSSFYLAINEWQGFHVPIPFVSTMLYTCESLDVAKLVFCCNFWVRFHRKWTILEWKRMKTFLYYVFCSSDRWNTCSVLECRGSSKRRRQFV